MNFLNKNIIKNYRDNISTVNTDGSRKWIYPRKINGFYYKIRSYISYIIIAIFCIIPFIRINGDPLFKFDFINHEVFIFSTPFYQQDIFIISLFIILIIIFISIFTTIYGRIFCGWICPQTIILEMVFRKIEYLVEGDRLNQIKLNNAPWSINKIRKKIIKWTIFFLISVFISHIFFSYFIGLDKLIYLIKSGPQNNYFIFCLIIINSGVIYFVFSWFREQACTLVCPYGRLQSILINKNTILVNYDYKRGEKKRGIRHKFKKNENRILKNKGDCIDCNQCVTVCPTGIDIRNGNQLECINCTLCIDACDTVMKKIGFNTGLIRYTSENNIINNNKINNKKNIIFFLLFILFIGFSGIILLLKKELDVNFFRIPGTDHFISNNYIVNTYEYKIFNKSSKSKIIKINILSHKGKILIPKHNNNFIKLEKRNLIRGIMYIYMPINKIFNTKTKIQIGIHSYDKKYLKLYKYNTYFLGPFNF